MSELCAITRRVEFDAGHRIPLHGSKCRNMHGHRYVLNATVVGRVQTSPGADQGMVTDFGDLKSIMMAEVGEPWDHAFLVYHQDHQALLALDVFGKEHKTVILDCVPTAENLAKIAFELIDGAIRSMPGDTPFFLQQIELWETPNCKAVYPAVVAPNLGAAHFDDLR